MAAANKAMGNGLVAGLRLHGLVERPVRRFPGHAGWAKTGQVARMTPADAGRHEPLDPDRGSRDGGSTPLRWTRLT